MQLLVLNDTVDAVVTGTTIKSDRIPISSYIIVDCLIPSEISNRLDVVTSVIGEEKQMRLALGLVLDNA